MAATIRLLIAETLLGWAMAIVPKQHPDGERLIKCVRDYLAQSLAEN